LTPGIAAIRRTISRSRSFGTYFRIAIG
jgi:hypothetical protein